MIQVKSRFEDTAIVFADAGSAIRIAQGEPVTFKARNTHPAATHDWDLGDGATATGVAATHTYPEPGFYVVKLATVVNQPGGARTRHFVAVTVDNAPPKVNAGPDLTVKEGDEVALSGSFSDPGWLDSHTASWAWGDDDPPTPGTVAERHEPPAGVGSVMALHAWGDAGTYTARLSVRDNHGGLGEDEATVTVLNVPPTVDAGSMMFAYPDMAITLRGTFTDPGWLDAHDGHWDFGDGSPALTATIEEHHEPPRGTGTVVASHVYRARGCYCCTCTVIDDDGGVGSASTIVRVVDVLNAGFEHGFRGLLTGAVANEWEPYAATIAEFHVPSRPSALPAGAFAAEELLVRQGQRSQRVHVDSETRAGVYQRIGANPDWTYQIAAWYCLLEGSGGMVRLGVDPAGGVDATAAGIIWMTGRTLGRWEELTARVVAAGDGITIFLEATGRYQPTREDQEDIADRAMDRVRRDRGQGADACFDLVQLLAVQPLPTAPCDAPHADRPAAHDLIPPIPRR